jgi:uncharacterized protein YjbI with pentapeptide repeats
METILSANEYTGLTFKSGDYRNLTLEMAIFSECKFIKCTFRESSLINCKFSHCIFQDCDFGLTKFTHSFFAEIIFKKCQLVGINWTETSLNKKNYMKPVDFDECVLNHSTFIGLVLKKLKLSRCIAQNVDFSEVDLSGADCRWSDFTNSRFHHSNLTAADFRGAKNYTIPVLDNVVKKARFSLPEAMSLLDGLEIELNDADISL